MLLSREPFQHALLSAGLQMQAREIDAHDGRWRRAISPLDGNSVLQHEQCSHEASQLTDVAEQNGISVTYAKYNLRDSVGEAITEGHS